MQLEYKLAVVTGASSGVGKAIALTFAEEIATLAVWLVSGVAAYVTKGALFIDGGMIRHAGSL